jgi:hypothetical protein
MEPIVFITEPLLSEQFVQFRFAAPLAKWLTRSYDVTVAAPAMSASVRTQFERMGVHPISGGAWFPPLRHPRDEIPSYVASWARDALFGWNGRRMEQLLEKVPGLRINLSMTSSVRSDVWYIQGRPVGPVLRTIGPSLRRSLRLPIALLGEAAGLVDEKHIRLVAQRSGAIYTNSGFLRSWFEGAGIPVQGTVPQYLFPLDFAPTTTHPRRDYALVYLGKETELATVHALVRTGVPVKVFGGKSEDWIDAESKFDRYPNLEVEGRVTHEQLKDLYTHALFTAFPFTEEPFGLVPIESMACGTPVLTYAKQGPGETVVDGVTGWLVHNADEFHSVARRIFARAYPHSWAGAAIARSQEFRLDRVAHQWRGMLHDALGERLSKAAPEWFGSVAPGVQHTPAH